MTRSFLYLWLLLATGALTGCVDWGSAKKTIAAVNATADALSSNLAQMQFLVDARETLRGFKQRGDD
jgi:hypothetical protein